MRNPQSVNSHSRGCASYNGCYVDVGKGVTGENSNTIPVINPPESASGSRRRNHTSELSPADFWSRAAVAGPDDCWHWQGTVLKRNGYGMFYHPSLKNTTPAHRVAWMLTHGAIPDGLYVLHRCDSRCVNPAHLFLGTQLDNMRDMAAKGRRSPHAHSPKGRPWSPEQRAKLTAARRLRAAKQIEARALRSGRAETA